MEPEVKATEYEKVSNGREKEPPQDGWFVVHTYSGYENKVKTNLELKVQSMGMEDVIRQILVPVEETIEERNGVEKIVKRKIFPGYVILEMTVTDKAWYVVRNTPGVTGFVGTATKPVPLSDSEVAYILESQGKSETQKTYVTDMEVGHRVRIISEPFSDKIGVIESIQSDKGKFVISLEDANADTTVEVGFDQVEPVE